jgi:hypothetical protein
MKKSIFKHPITFIFISITFFACEKNETKTVLSQNKTVEIEAPKLQSISKSISTLEQQYYIFLKNNIAVIKTKMLDTSGINKLVDYSKNHFTVLLNPEEENIILKYFKDQKLDLTSLSNFELFITNNNHNQSYNISKFISLTRVSLIIYNEEFKNPNRKNISEYENCLTGCIENKLSEIFDNGNIIDQALFIAGTPRTFLEIIASCSYGCYKELNKNTTLAK